ncbi:MAG: single-stranded-DNA-specific exonuclease RecJ [Deltaproteobacteria bacterium]|nr:single-stranded-DNA-specific exonuclease RecJ [Deltaproteobacteria bacterium]
MPRRRWIELDAPPEADVRRLADALDLSEIVAHVLAQRGLTDVDEADRFLHPKLADLPHPDGMVGMDAAVRVIVGAVERGETICVYGDYDVDGITATSLLLDFFRRIDQPAFYFVPDRVEHGYGFHPEVVDQIAARGAKLIITVDTGITAHEACAEAKRRGLAVVITDHHELPETLPDADAIINPHQPGCAFEVEQLTGVGLAFFLSAALRAELDKRGRVRRGSVDVRDFLDLAALGTIADMAPVTGANRALVAAGLERLTTAARTGVAALKEVAGIGNRPVDYYGASFTLNPRLNAAGRMANAAIAVELMTTDDPMLARRNAKEIDDRNAERQETENRILQAARRMVASNPHADKLRSLVLYGDDWHPGVIGIVASRIIEEFYRPTVVISMDGRVGKGSGRSIDGFNLFDALVACRHTLVQFGGHAFAAGLSVDRAKLPEFMTAFEKHARATLRDDDLQPRLKIAAVVDPASWDLRTAGQIVSMAPFGIGNPQPVFASKRAKVLYKTTLKEKHLKLRIEAGGQVISALGWRMGDRFDEVGEAIDIAYTVGISDFRGEREVQLTLKDF